MRAKPRTVAISHKASDPLSVDGRLGVISEERGMVTTTLPTSSPGALHMEVTLGEPETGKAPVPKKAGLKVAMDRVLREKSTGREMSVPRELAKQLVTLSAASISQELRRSCTNLVARGGGEAQGSEKEYLLRRLEELLSLERRQVGSDLAARRQELETVRQSHREKAEQLDILQGQELEEMRRRQKEELEEAKEELEDQAEHLRKEVELLENEAGGLETSLEGGMETAQPGLTGSTGQLDGPSEGYLSELELELQCCSCRTVCRPPSHIYQCPEGDLLCTSCLPPSLLSCPDCGILLQGSTSRNRVLEKLAAKYFV